MAEVTLVKETLTESMVRGGESLTRMLDKERWALVAAFWLFDAEQNRWKLFFASPRVNADGPKGAYEAISRALSKLPDHFTSLQYITAISPEHPLVEALGTAFNTGQNVEGIRVFRNTINGRFIDDAYLYRVDVDSAAE